MLSLTFISSGSKGNSALLGLGGQYYLLDAGVSCKRICCFLRDNGLELSDLSGIFVTHEHSDHTGGLKVLLSKSPELPVYASRGTHSALSYRGLSIKNQVCLRRGKSLSLGGCTCRPFEVPHDALEPLGFRFSGGNSAITIATDLGHISAEVAAHMCDSDIICVESNYDRAMLNRCGYPRWLKARIEGPKGHLPNEGVCALLERVNKVPKALVLMHMSQESNTPKLALNALSSFFSGVGSSFKGLDLCIASQDAPTKRISV